MFSVETRFSSCSDCFLKVADYADNGHVAISIYSASEGPYAGLTVNVSGIETFGKEYSCVDTNNFPEGVELIKKLGIGEETDWGIESGWCTYPVFKFDMEKLKEYMS